MYFPATSHHDRLARSSSSDKSRSVIGGGGSTTVTRPDKSRVSDGGIILPVESKLSDVCSTIGGLAPMINKSIAPMRRAKRRRIEKITKTREIPINPAGGSSTVASAAQNPASMNPAP